MNFKKIINGLIVAGVLAVTIAGCASLTDLFGGGEAAPVAPVPIEQQLVLTSKDQVKVETPAEAIAVLSSEVVNDKLETAIGSNATNPPVLTVRGNLVGATAKYITVDPSVFATQSGWTEFLSNPSVLTAITGAIHGGESLLPWLGLVEGVLTIFSPRKRQNYGAAIKSAVTLDPLSAIKSAAAGFGVAHTPEP